MFFKKIKKKKVIFGHLQSIRHEDINQKEKEIKIGKFLAFLKII
jgi:hypothetical protein